MSVRIMSAARGVFAAAAFMGLLGSSASAQSPALFEKAQGQLAEISGKIAANGGQTRIIVELNTGFDINLAAATTQASFDARAAMNVMQQDVVSSIAGGNAAKATQLSVRTYSHLPMLALTATSADLETLAQDPRVKRIHDDALNAPMLDQSIPLIGMTTAPASTRTGAGMMVAVVDTGVAPHSTFLAGKIVEEACYSTAGNYSNVTITSLCPSGASTQTGAGSANPITTCSGISGCDHGTHVAGIAVGKGTGAGAPARGAAPDATLFAVQVFSKFTYTGTGTNNCCPSNNQACGTTVCVLAQTADVIAGLDRIIARRASLPQTLVSVNMSLGGGGPFTSSCDTDSRKVPIDTLRAANVATVIASGNNGYTNGVAAPACIGTAITVGNTTKSDFYSNSTNQGSLVDVLAPGTSIYASVFGNSYGFKTGTSMAAPTVAGAWATIRQAVPTATVSQIEAALIATGLPLTDSGVRNGGSGTIIGGGITKPRIRVDLAIASLLAGPGAAAMSVTPSTAVSAVGNIGGPFSPTTGSYTVQNSGGASMNWTASSSNTAVATVAPTSGTLAAGASTTVTATFTGTTLAVGSYSSTITFNNSTNAAGNTSRTANLTVNGAGGVPGNDNYASAFTMSGNSGSTTGTNVAATKENGEGIHYGTTTGANSVWWKWTPASSGQASINTNGSGFDTVLSVYKGASLSTRVQIVSDDDAGDSTSSLVYFNAIAGTTYYIAVDGYDSGEIGAISLAWSLNTTQGPIGLFGAVLPYARSVQVGTTATAFANIINSSTTAATNCNLQMPVTTSTPGTFFYRAINADNTLNSAIGPNITVPIAAGATQNFLFGFTPSAAFAATEIPIKFDCSNMTSVTSYNGVNTFILSAATTPVPDLIANGATISGDGIVSIPGNTGSTFFATSAVNIGAAGTITASVDDGGRGLPLVISICRTNPTTGVCVTPAAPAASATSMIANNEIATYAIFVTGTGNVAFDPAFNRLFLRLKDAGGVTRGATNVAVRTLVPADTATASTSAVLGNGGE